MALSFLASAGVSAIGGIISGFGARRRARQQARKARALNKKLKALVANRQDIVNPGDRAVDRSGMITNQFSNLQVATGAAEFQAEEADLSLANTLDTLRATGAGAGGATALAQAALRSKKGVSATIEKQEMQNAQLRAKGAEMAMQSRLKEGGRVDALKFQGDAFAFQAQEQRQFRDEDRLAAQVDNMRAQAAASRAESRAGFGKALGAIGGTALGVAAGTGSLKDRLAALGTSG
tara:strand:+ start:515 stop:1219 length:705 start_codon:yes stop_codon:yes gene_type:complete